jgi:hypothetical protein
MLTPIVAHQTSLAVRPQWLRDRTVSRAAYGISSIAGKSPIG